MRIGNAVIEMVDLRGVDHVKSQQVKIGIIIQILLLVFIAACICGHERRALTHCLNKLIAHPVIDVQFEIRAGTPVFKELHTIGELMGLCGLV